MTQRITEQQEHTDSSAAAQAVNAQSDYQPHQLSSSIAEGSASQRMAQRISSIGQSSVMQAQRNRLSGFSTGFSQSGSMIQRYANGQYSQPDGQGTIQKADFADRPANEEINPDIIGEGGIHEVAEENARPDDVPRIDQYRLAMHKLHNAVLILERSDWVPSDGDNLASTAELREVLVEVQGQGKDLAKDFKKSMRKLTSDASVDDLRHTYTQGMMVLTERLEELADQGERVVNRHSLLEDEEDLSQTGTTIWRDKWLTTKNAVDNALTNRWDHWKATLKGYASAYFGHGEIPAGWAARVDAENWSLCYGGSLAKGYKGPPKQQTRFLSSWFDVDANINAPAIAKYLLEDGMKVDRGQIDPRGHDEVGINEMDQNLDEVVKAELRRSEIIPEGVAPEAVVSEPFETRVNATGELGEVAGAEVARSSAEQAARDRVTNVRNTHPELMVTIGVAIGELGGEPLLEDGHLVGRPLTNEEIVAINDAVTRILADAEDYGAERE